jgi:hypothetical protein
MCQSGFGPSDPPCEVAAGLHMSLKLCLRFEVFTAVTMKNAVFLDVTPYGSCSKRRFGGM